MFITGSGSGETGVKKSVFSIFDGISFFFFLLTEWPWEKLKWLKMIIFPKCLFSQTPLIGFCAEILSLINPTHSYTLGTLNWNRSHFTLLWTLFIVFYQKKLHNDLKLKARSFERIWYSIQIPYFHGLYPFIQVTTWLELT